MKSPPLIILSAFLFSTVGLGAAWGIGSYTGMPGIEPNFERTMFILLPLGGAVFGWFAGYLATPLRDEK